MGVRGKKTAVQELEIGMFVSDLDRPWHETPFPIQGFVIRTQEQLDQLVRYCRAVYVDVAEVRPKVVAESPLAGIRKNSNILKLPAIHIRNPRHYTTSEPITQAISQADHLLGDLSESMSHIIGSIEAGKLPSFYLLEQSVRQVCLSIISNPDALLWLSRVQHRDEYSYQHALNATIWATVLGRHMGLEPDVLEHLATGTMLSQIGKARLPVQLLKEESELTGESLKRYQRYVPMGVKILEQAGMPRVVINIVKFHRERHNGRGFPQGVNGEAIPLLAKISGLVDYYEGLIEPRTGFDPLTPAQAVAKLFEVRNQLFQDDLVERFIQAIGIYPTGTIVQLNNLQTGVVLSHRPERRLWPTVMVVADEHQRPLKAGQVIDLVKYNEKKGNDEALSISGCLPFGVEGIDPSSYQINEPAQNKRWSIKRLLGSSVG